MAAGSGLVGVIIAIMIAALVLFSAALPTIIESYESIKDNLTTGEQNVAKLIVLFLILGVVFVIGKGTGMF